MIPRLTESTFADLVETIAFQQEERRRKMEGRVQAALLASFFEVEGVRLSSDQSCQIAESFAVGDYVKCNYLLKEVGL